MLTHPPTSHAQQSRGFDQTPATVGARLAELTATLARGKTRRSRSAVEAEITTLCRDSWVTRVLTWQLEGDIPAEHRLSWNVRRSARTALEREVFGNRVLITDRQDWPVAEVVAGYRSPSEAEFSFRHRKDPHMVSFSPMHHWTDHTTRIPVFTCVLAPQIAHLLRRTTDQASLSVSVRELLSTVGGIEESVLTYPSTGGRPTVRRMLTETTAEQDRLATIFGLDH